MREDELMQQQIEKLLETIVADYDRWQLACADAQRSETAKSPIQQKMYEEFKEELGYKVGNKYIKITTKNGGSVWGFVVNTDTDTKFARGDILMAAGYNAPARNKARGNVFKGYNINWTGPQYLK